jgi:hypothetical protein
MMQKIILPVLFCFLFFYSKGQKVLVNLNTGYGFTCNFDAYHDTSAYYAASVNQGVKYGLDAGYMPDRFFSADLSLMYQRTTLPASYHYAGIDHAQNYNISLLWVMAGGTSYLPIGNVDLFFGTHIGICAYHFFDSIAVKKNAARFAWSVRGGFCYFFTKRVGVNIRADALFSTDPLKEEFYTPGDNTGFSYFFQFGFSTGFTINLSAPKKKAK